jgi:hypothetical protein
MKKQCIFYTLALLGCMACTLICLRPAPKQAGQVNIPLYAVEVQQQELIDRGHDIKKDGKFGVNTDLALTIEVCKEHDYE